VETGLGANISRNITLESLQRIVTMMQLDMAQLFEELKQITGAETGGSGVTE